MNIKVAAFTVSEKYINTKAKEWPALRHKRCQYARLAFLWLFFYTQSILQVWNALFSKRLEFSNIMYSLCFFL